MAQCEDDHRNGRNHPRGDGGGSGELGSEQGAEQPTGPNDRADGDLEDAQAFEVPPQAVLLRL
jgi:hypothetical protein